MVKQKCFSLFFLKKEKSKKEFPDAEETKMGHGTLKVNLKHLVGLSKENGPKTSTLNFSVPFVTEEKSACNLKVVREENPNLTAPEAAEAAYDGSDENDQNSPLRRDASDVDLQAIVINGGDATDPSITKSVHSYEFLDAEMNGGSEKDEVGRHDSDPGIEKTEFWGLSKLKHSCSHAEIQGLVTNIADQLPLSKCHSFEDLPNSAESRKGDMVCGLQTSPLSAITSCSADKVMLKRTSSSQVLPSRSRRLWWKLFLWSHRNMRNPVHSIPNPLSITGASNQKDGYWSDTVELGQVLQVPTRKSEMRKSDLSGSLSDESKTDTRDGNNTQIGGEVCGGVAGLWAPNQWVAFPTEAAYLSRVNEWVNSLEVHSLLPLEDHGDGEKGETRESANHPLSTEKLPITSSNVADEVLQANNIVRSMNSSSAVAHIAGVGLKIVPNISPFISLRSVNLSGNFIVNITPGSLPKSLQTLDLSRNKIITIDGLRELTRLRVLNLSYNRISRIGRGLSSCVCIKELYLTGNKISDIDGLHRLLKLTVLDLSFNKITTTKALGQLVANYHSLLALNLLGNPIQSNVGDDQLRKTVPSLLPQLAYLNKQPIKPQRAREASMGSVAKAALGNHGWNSRRKVSKRVSQVSPLIKRRGTEGVSHRGRHQSKSNQQRSRVPRRLPAFGSQQQFTHGKGTFFDQER